MKMKHGLLLLLLLSLISVRVTATEALKKWGSQLFVTNPAILMISPDKGLAAFRGLQIDHFQEHSGEPAHMVWNNSLSLTYVSTEALLSSAPSARDVRLGRAQLNDPSVTKVLPLGKFPGQMGPPSFGVDAWHSCRPAGGKHEFATGPEDPRLFHWKGKPHLLFVSGDPVAKAGAFCDWKTTFSRLRSHIAPIDVSKKVPSLGPVTTVRFKTGTRQSRMDHKNWMPIIHNETLFMSHSIEPHVVLKVQPPASNDVSAALGISAVSQATVAYESSNAAMLARYGFISGGSPAIPTPDGTSLIAIVHNKIHGRQYMNHAILLEPQPPFRITKMSAKPLPLHCIARVPKRATNSSVCFASGLTIAGDTGNMVVSYGAGDSEAWVWTAPWQAAIEHLFGTAKKYEKSPGTNMELEYSL